MGLVAVAALSLPVVVLSKPQDKSTISSPDTPVADLEAKPHSAIDDSDFIWNASALLGFLMGATSLLISTVFRPINKEVEKTLATLADNHRVNTDKLREYSGQVLSQGKILEEVRVKYGKDLASHGDALKQLRQKVSANDLKISSQSKSRPLGQTAEAISTSPSSSSHDPSIPVTDKGGGLSYGINESAQLATTPEASPEEDITQQYLSALHRNDRSALRRMVQEELNITQDSEDALIRGTSALSTKLLCVSGGGSYLLIPHAERHWLFPTAQTLASFTTNQPQKGIFDYERLSISAADLRKPAEVQEIAGGIWEVISKGIVIVPA